MNWTIDIENIAGILDGEATIEPGLNAVRASNWQGKSSFIRAIKTGLGVSTALTEGEDRGRVDLDTPDREVTVELVRENGSVRRTGFPYLEDEYDIARTDLFACLDERNEIRRAVREGENLESILMRPLDLQNIDRRIADLNHEREQIESELAQAREAKKRLPQVEQAVAELEDELADLREQYEAAIAERDGETADSPQSVQNELAQAQSERDQAKKRIDRLERSIDRAENRFEEKRAELADLGEVGDGDVESELAVAREELQEVKRDIEVLQALYSANEMVLSEDRLDLLGEVKRDLMGDTVTCWTCGNEASRDAIEDQTDAIGEKITTLRAKAETRRDEVEKLEARREDLKQARQRRRDLESEVASLEERLADYERSLEDARDRLEQAERTVEELSDAVDRSVEKITDIESDIKYREAELKDTRDELDALETRAARVDTLEDELASVESELETLRNRKDEIKYEARDAFDEAMEDVLSRFDTGFETARLTANFDLVVARDGRQASLDALSEGELELLGFVAALAGYESFDVAESVPILLVDGVGGIADDNLHTLVEYLQERASYLVFTIYPEYTAFDGSEIDPGDWEVASGRESVTN